MSAKQKARVVETQAVTADTVLSAEDISKMLIRARREVNLSVIQEYVIRQLSEQIEGKSKKQLADEMERSEWYIYNVRRDAVRKLALMLGVVDEEELFPILGLRRGRRMPTRHTKYWGQAGSTVEVEVMAAYIDQTTFDPDEENIDDGGAAAAEEYTEFGSPDDEPASEDDDEEDEESDDSDDEDVEGSEVH